MDIEKASGEKPENTKISSQYCEQSKTLLRREIRERLQAHSLENEELSSVICRRLTGLEVFQVAGKKNRLMIYLGFGNEVRTVSLLTGSSVVVPCCEGDTIVPIRIFSRDELEAGRLGILEPKQSVRNDVGRFVGQEQLDVIIVPGLAFDMLGNRLGRGKGYYDRFLSRCSSEVISIGLAFECQIVSSVPVNHRDYPVSMIVTEERVINTSHSIETKEIF